MNQDNQTTAEDNSLESPATATGKQPGVPPANPQPTPKQSPISKLKSLLKRINLFSLLFAVVLLIGGLITLISIQSSRSNNENKNVSGQELSADALAELSQNSVTVGDSKQTLNIASNSIFGGQVLIKESLDVAGTIRVGGSLSLPGITVSGSSSFEEVQVTNNLNITGNAVVQGGASIQGNLSVSGSATFAGSISASSLNIDSLTLSGDINFNRHISTGGSIPSVSAGTGVGSGGTVSLSGSDVSGTVTINIGGGPVAGTLANITFSNNYGSDTPHVVITPIGSSAAGLNYYITRTSTGFSIATTNAATAATSFSFDYIVIN